MVENKKTCSKCGIEKDMSEFVLRTDTNKRRNQCHICGLERDRINSKKWYRKNKKEKDIKNREYVLSHKEDVNRNSRKRYKKNPEKSKQASDKWRLENKKRVIANQRKWWGENRDKIKIYNKTRYEKIKKDLHKRLCLSVSNMIRRNLTKRGIKKNRAKSFGEILFYSVEELRCHLELLFEDGMSWDNYGKGDGKWHIDHVVPDSWHEYKSMINR